MSSDHLDCLDPRFPIAWTLPPVIFDALADEWDGRTTARVVVAYGTRRDLLTQATYIQATPAPPPARTIYLELTPERLNPPSPPPPARCHRCGYLTRRCNC